MATISKRGEKWRAQVAVSGVRVSKSFARKSEAAAWAAATEAAIRAGQYGRAPSDTLADVLARYASEVSPSKRGERWERVRLAALARDPIAAARISSVTPDMLGQWRDRRSQVVGPASVLRDITLLTAVFEHARREWRLITTNPWRDVRKPRAPAHRERLISNDEIDRLCLALGFEEANPVETLSHEVAVMFLLAIETAMRAGELSGLTWASVDLTRRVARIGQTKNGDARDVPLSSRAVELFDLLPRTGASVFRVAKGSRDALFRRARDKAGIADLHFHDTRAEACTRLAQRLNVLELARMIGHRDPKSLMAYYRETAEELARKLR